MDELCLDTGHTVRTGQTYTLAVESAQLGLREGTKMTVSAITGAPDGYHVAFTCNVSEVGSVDEWNGNPVEIYGGAMDEMLIDGHLRN